MISYKTTLPIMVISIFLSFALQGCFAQKKKDPALVKAEAKKLEKEKLHQAHEEDFPHKSALAKSNGYRGYIEFKSIEKFTSEYEYGRLDVNDYKNYVISNQAGGTYAYTFTRVSDGIEIYQPDKKYGWVTTLGIKRHKEQRNKLKKGSPLLDTKTVSFLGVSTYKTIFGVYQRILLFDRAQTFRVVSNSKIKK